jgi:hypothetical protein
MTKNWTKTEDGTYVFSVDNEQKAILKINLKSNNSKASVKIADSEFAIRRVGFWKTGIEIIDASNSVIAKAYTEKWYANSLIFDYKSRKYKVRLRNNPYAEFVISEGEKDILAYGINNEYENDIVNVRITCAEKNLDYMLDVLLWYLFIPIATENMGDHFVFMLMLTTA